MEQGERRLELRRIRRERYPDLSRLLQQVGLTGLGEMTPEQRYKSFERGEVEGRLPRRVVEDLLERLRVEEPLSGYCLAPYEFGKTLESHIASSGLKRKEVAASIEVSASALSRILNGVAMPTAEQIRLLSHHLGLSTTEADTLFELAGFYFEGLGLPEPDSKDQRAVERLFVEMQRGIGAVRSRPVKAVLPKEPEIPLGAIWERERVIDTAQRLIYRSAQQRRRTISVSLGRYLSGPDDYSVTELTQAFKYALAEGCDIEILLGSSEDPEVAANCVIEALEFFGWGRGKFLPRVYDPSEVFEPPLHVIQASTGKILHIFPREQAGNENLESAVLSDGNTALGKHFRLRYNAAPPLAEFYSNTMEGHLQVEQSLLDSEMQSNGRFLLKRGINGLMLPETKACQEWERAYLAEKYRETAAEDVTRIIPQLRKARNLRVAHLQRTLTSQKCCDICSMEAVGQFLRQGSLLFPEKERDSTVHVRVEIVQRMLWWLENFDNYMLALVPDDYIRTVFFQVCAEHSVLLEVKGKDQRSYHLRLFGRRLRTAFESYFLSRWREIPSQYRDKQSTAEFLRTIEEQLLGFLHSS